MTDEELQKLVKWLRNMQHTYGQSTKYGAIADEIVRLTAENKRLTQERDNANTKLRAEWSR